VVLDAPVRLRWRNMLGELGPGVTGQTSSVEWSALVRALTPAFGAATVNSVGEREQRNEGRHVHLSR
jgi:hypothetical protein